MVTNINQPVWTSGEASFSGGGAQSAILIPSDIDTVIVDISDATTADVVGIEVSQDPRTDLVGIVERPLRYSQVAINDLGGSGELRMNAAAGLDFTDDGWAVGDTFEVVSHRVPEFGPDDNPTTIADVQVYTVSSVAALVIGFSEDPAYSVAEGEIVVAQSRAAVVEGSLTWASQVGLDASNTQATVIVTGAAGRKIRLNQSTGTATVTWEFKGTLQSGVRPPPFIANVESRPYSGPQPGATGIELAVNAAPVWTEETLSGTYGVQRFAAMTLAGTDFDVLGVKQYDMVNFSGHSVTGNTGLFRVRGVFGSKLQMYQPLKGVVGTDDARVRLGQYVSDASGVVDLSDYDELMLQLLGATDSYLKFQETVVPDTLDPILDSGQAGRTDWDITHAGTLITTGPFGTSQAFALGTTAPAGNIISDGAAQVPGVSTLFSMGGWFRVDALEDGTLMSKSDGAILTSILAGIELSITVGGVVEANLKAADLADPGTWIASTAYVTGDRVRPVADDQSVQECEIAGTTDTLEPTWAAEGATVVDGTVTWRNVDDDRSTFHSVGLTSTYAAATWMFLTVVREADGTWVLYKDGVEEDSLAVAVDDTTPGSFGTPKPFDFTVDMGPAVTEDWQIQGVAAANDMDGDFAYAFVADGVALTATQVASLYDTALDIGLN